MKSFLIVLLYVLCVSSIKLNVLIFLVIKYLRTVVNILSQQSMILGLVEGGCLLLQEKCCHY